MRNSKKGKQEDLKSKSKNPFSGFDMDAKHKKSLAWTRYLLQKRIFLLDQINELLNLTTGTAAKFTSHTTDIPDTTKGS